MIGLEQTPMAALVSVGIPTYERPAGLRRTLQCLAGQTHRRLEIIVSDNSRGPESEAVVREFQRRDGRIVFHRQPHDIGMLENFKFVLAQATGEFFFWAADDDEWAPDFVETCLAHMEGVGSVMTGMQTAVRPLRLLRPNPAAPISAARSPFQNAMGFLSVFQPSLFYGVHRTATARASLPDRLSDFFDVYFVLRQILDHGFQVVPGIRFTVGLDSVASGVKSLNPRPGAAYEYGPFVRHATWLIVRHRNLRPTQKVRLLFLLGYWVVNWFAHAERAHRPLAARLAAATRRGLRLLRPLLRVPLPLAPDRIFLPADPAGTCYRFLPPDELDTVGALHRHLATARAELRAKDAAAAELRREIARRLPWVPRRRGRRPALEPREPDPAGGADPVEALRHELGSRLLELEAREAEIQALARTLARVRRLLGPPRRLRAATVAGVRRLGRGLLG
jgi:glycosyltransferase involved in cell wall biosynthesis